MNIFLAHCSCVVSFTRSSARALSLTLDLFRIVRFPVFIIICLVSFMSRFFIFFVGLSVHTVTFVLRTFSCPLPMSQLQSYLTPSRSQRIRLNRFQKAHPTRKNMIPLLCNQAPLHILMTVVANCYWLKIFKN